MAATIEVQGTGKVRTMPDRALLTFSAGTVKPSATEAREAHTPIAQRMNDAIIKAADLQAKDIIASRITVQANWETTKNEHKRNGFIATNSIAVHIRDLSKVTQVIDAAVKAGATTVDGPNLHVTNERPHTNEARKRAVADARAKCDLYCAEMGLDVLGIDELEEVVDHYYGASNVAGKAALAAAAAGGAEELMVGEIELQRTVRVKFRVSDEFKK